MNGLGYTADVYYYNLSGAHKLEIVADGVVYIADSLSPYFKPLNKLVVEKCPLEELQPILDAFTGNVSA